MTNRRKARIYSYKIVPKQNYWKVYNRNLSSSNSMPKFTFTSFVQIVENFVDFARDKDTFREK